MGPILKRKLMRATTTGLISKIWSDYYATHFPENSTEGMGMMSKRYLRRKRKKMAERGRACERLPLPLLPLLIASCGEAEEARRGGTWD